MANPAPTINQINAFNATQGTTIDFNIIGGTELVRSNRIYIYDLSDNSLICTHLYVSTESIHELPPNTDGSIVYEDGKSSADFVNGAQYYAQIQTFTDIAGTEGGSGLSVAKMFWCLVDPTLTITTIPSTISTTSYNVSATYNANTSVVSNIIQQYQFSLYSATGSLLQSSGVVVGSGTQQGTSTTYDISYNFSGLSVGSSYYVVVDVTTTQGMSVSAQSSTFTVSIDTPTLGEATVVNNACDGYISVTSNLSSEYGGSGSGEIVSFETDSENVFTKLQVDLDPIQDLNGYDAPWVGGAGKNKIKITADTLDNSQNSTSVITDSGITVTATGVYGRRMDAFTVEIGETYTLSFKGESDGDFHCVYVQSAADWSSVNLIARLYPETTEGSFSYTFTATTNVLALGWYVTASISSGYMTIKDLQLELGSTATTYAPYENICPISGHDSVSVEVVGKNLIDSSNLYQNGANRVDIGTQAFDYHTYLKAGTYTFSNNGVGVVYYRLQGTSDNNEIHNQNVQSGTFTITQDGYYAFWVYYWNGISVSDVTDVQLELGTTATAYEPYNGTTYTTTLPSTTYGGTLDVVSGVLTVDRVKLSATWGNFSKSSVGNFTRGSFWVGLDNIVYPQHDEKPQICNVAPLEVSFGNDTLHFYCNSSSALVFLPNDTADSTPIEIVYELATPTTTQLTPQQIQTLVGQNNLWSEDGEISLAYHIPITNLLVKRQDVGDVSGDWLTLYSQPITQASDMDFTFIDFTNQYGKTYKYALVPLLTQTQSGVEVEVEGGYTVSDEVQSVFDGVFIVDSTGSQKCKANVGYGNVDMNQTVGTITPIGAKYPVVITNSKNQYHNGSIYGTIVPDDYYFNGNLSRIDMVNKRDELEQFLTNKRAKIIKDWNGKIWLVMIMDNVSCTFNNNYGMGIVNFNTNWVEVGDPTNQQDLQATGLINVGGV